MGKTWTCPFFSWEEGLSVYCEGAKLDFKGAAERQAYIDNFCAGLPGWEGCPVAALLYKKHGQGGQKNTGRASE